MPLHNDFHEAEKTLLEKLGIEIHELIRGKNTGYNACHFKLHNKSIEFRSSKITPKKIGQFAAIWRRNEQGLTQPFKESDPLDFIIISSRSGDKSGLFIFPKSALVDQAIITSGSKTGKRGIRIYPPWEKTISGQTQKTQSWQIRYFISLEDSIDQALLNKMLAGTDGSLRASSFINFDV